jgi:voltage-gated potassium channel
MTASAAAAALPAGPERREVVHGNAYNIFILVVTILSLVIMFFMFMPFVDAPTWQLLNLYDNILCFVFIGDFIYNLRGTRPRRDYFISKRGWLDLLGSIPNFGLSQYGALLRLARLSRLARITRILRGKNQKALIADVVQNRGSYALLITLILAMLVIVISSVLVLQFELKNPDANITTGGDAAWWAVVTITTVGYGDHYPITFGGRMTATFVMFAGIGIIGALASILASLLVTSSPADSGAADETAAATHEAASAIEAAGDAVAAASDAVVAIPAQTAADHQVAQELANIRAELAALRATLEHDSPPPSPAGGSA